MEERMVVREEVRRRKEKKRDGAEFDGEKDRAWTSTTRGSVFT